MSVGGKANEMDKKRYDRNYRIDHCKLGNCGSDYLGNALTRREVMKATMTGTATDLIKNATNDSSEKCIG